MNRKIDLGEDKNLVKPDKKAAKKPQLAFLMDDLPKSGEEALLEARTASWGQWINSEPLVTGYVDDNGASYLFYISENLRKKVVLLDVWDYTLLPCRRSLSYVLEWHKRYSSAGLVTIGVHAPLFEFAKDRKRIEDAVRDLGITYPVVLDNNFHIWRSLENRYWPRRVLFDAAGKTCQDVVGEGQYIELEKTIQLLLREQSPGLACPPVLRPLRASDQLDYEDKEVTSEIFFGQRWNSRLGNSGTPVPASDEFEYKDETGGAYAPDLPYLDGMWVHSQESIYGGANKKGEIKLTIKFTGTDVYIVAGNRSKNTGDIAQPLRLLVTVDGRIPSDEIFGEDVSYNEQRKCMVTLRGQRLYHVASRLEYGLHELKLHVEENVSDTMELYALFFEHRG
jgi:hypothetical protein